MMRWGGHVARVEEMRIYIDFWSENLKGKDHSEDLVVDGRIILEWILGKYGGKLWTGFMCLRIETTGGLSEYGNEISGSIKGGIECLLVSQEGL